MIRLRAEWRPRATRDLLHWIQDLDAITSIARTVEEIAASFGDPSLAGRIIRPANNPRAVLIPVVRGLFVSGIVDPLEAVLYVTAINPGPDPDADPNADPEPDEYEDDE